MVLGNKAVVGRQWLPEVVCFCVPWPHLFYPVLPTPVELEKGMCVNILKEPVRPITPRCKATRHKLLPGSAWGPDLLPTCRPAPCLSVQS